MDLDIVVETPKGFRNKYGMEHERGRIRLDRTLFTATQYPADYGFVPHTCAEDGEPLEALVLVAESTFPGCQGAGCVVGVFWMRDQNGPDAKLLCMPAGDPRQAHIADMPDLPRHLAAEIGHFFAVYNAIEPGKCTEVRGWQDRALAEQIVREAYARFER